MSRPPGLSSEGDDDDDAALIDSFFLPGGILDPDEEEEEEQDNVQNMASPFASNVSSAVMFSRVPSNPWGDDLFKEAQDSEQVAGDGGPSDDPLLLSSSAVPLGERSNPEAHSTSPPPIVRPPPGYTHQPASSSLFGTERVENQDKLGDAVARVARSRLPEGDFLIKSAQSNTKFMVPNPNSNGVDTQAILQTPLVSGPPPGFQNRTIQRPKARRGGDGIRPQTGMETLGNSNPSNRRPPKVTDADDFVDIPGTLAKMAILKPKHSNGQAKGRHTNPFMAIVDSDSEDDNDDHEQEKRVLKAPSSMLETADEIEGSGFDLEMDDDEEDEDIEESTRGESSFPMETLTFISRSVKRESSTSSISTSSDSSSEQDDSDGDGRDVSQSNVERTDETTEALNSEVAVILDIENSSTKQGSACHATTDEDMKASASSANMASSSKRDTRQTSSSPDLKAEKSSSMQESSSKNRDDASLLETLGSIRTSIVSKASVWSKAFQDYIAVMDDFRAVIAVLAMSLWGVTKHALTLASKAIAVFSLLFFQVWKFSLVEIIEEPKISVCYLIFYFMPHFCSIFLRIFVIPHWTPHFITCIAVWSLCAQIDPGPLHLGPISLYQIPNLLLKNGGVQPTETRPRDERACRTILRILRFVLPVFFFVDGFSTEFGTIMGVSGSSRLTTAFMMSLVRKNLVSSPVGWVSWAVQVLLATHNPSSFLVELLVFASGLSSIRLIRYLEGRRVGIKKRQGKYH